MRSLFAASGLALAACGGGHAPSVPSPSDFADARRSAECAYFVRCGVWSSDDACLAANPAFEFSYLHDVRGIAAAVDSGRAAWHEDAAEACVNAIFGASCDETSESARWPSQACYEMYSGNVDGFGACAEDADCESRYCTISTCDDNACCTGRCESFPAPHVAQLGESCVGALACAPSTACTYVADAQICAPLAGEGEHCQYAGDCAAGFGCTANGACKPPVALGAACDDDEVCGDVSAGCLAGTCQRLPMDGAPCGGRCAGPLVCDATTQICVAGIARGGACNGIDSCAIRGDLCSSLTRRCAPPAPDGDACADGDDCASGACSTTGSCIEPIDCPAPS